MKITLLKPGKWAALLALHLLFVSPLLADTQPQSSTGDLFFWADRTAFTRSDSLIYHEIYLRLYCRDFEFENRDDLQKATYRLNIAIRDSQGVVPTCYDMAGGTLKKLQWEKRVQADIETDIQDQVALETFTFLTPPGRYTLQLTLEDLVSNKKATCHLPPNTQIVKQSFALSDIQIARHIDDTSPAHRPLKNGLWILPNVTRTLTTQQTALSFYFEIYGLSDGEKNTFDLAYTLRDTQNHPVKMYTSTRYKKPGATCVKTETLDLPALVPGTYALQVTVRDSDTRQITTQNKTFFVSAPAPPTLATDPVSLQRYYDQIAHIAQKSELDVYKTLSPEDKVAFILKFWKDRDPTPDTPENEFAAEHFRRIQYSDHTFSSRPKQRGSETDKGRVYIRYGPPTDIERNAFNAIGKDYEIWTYEHLKYYQFFFVDRLGDSVQELVHSTMPGERYNPNWRDEQLIGAPSAPLAPPPDAFGGGPPPSTAP